MGTEKGDSQHQHREDPPPPSQYGTFQGVANHPRPAMIGFPQPVPPLGATGAPPPSSQYYAHGYQAVPGACMDDSSLSPYIRLLYDDVIHFPDPFKFLGDQLKFTRVSAAPLWELRRILIERLKRGFDEELVFLEEIFKRDTRNQLKWAYRQWVVAKFAPDAPKKDLESTKKIIDDDANNPLAWSHRQWVFQAFGGDWDDELAFCDKIIGEDSFNIFAWYQRYFVISMSPTLGGLGAMRDREVDYALQAINVEPHNECPWTYLRLLYKDDLKSLVMDRRVEDACLCVFQREKCENQRYAFNAFVVDDLSHRRGSVHALQMVLDLVRLGFKPSLDLLNALRAVCQSDPGFVDKARSVLQATKFEVEGALCGSDPGLSDPAVLVLQEAKSDV